MRLLLAQCALALTLAAGTAFADTTSVILGAPPGMYRNAATHCGGAYYNADSSIQGGCTVPISQACSGRGCVPVVNTQYYNVAYDATGTPLSYIICMSIRTHNPQPAVVTYYNGFGPGQCTPPVLSSSTTTMVDMGFGPAPFYLIAIAPSGLTEIVANFGVSHLVTF